MTTGLMIRSNRLAALTLLVFATTGCPAEETEDPADAGPVVEADAGPTSTTIADIASSDENFSTLLPWSRRRISFLSSQETVH